jgi:predicted secreted Zn-dependent protease
MGVRLTETTSQYEVTGQTVAELLRSIRSNAVLQPDHTSFAGATTWNLGWLYQGSRVVPGGCSTRAVTVNLDVRVRYPAWTDSSVAPPALRDEWNRYIAALKTHEGRHAAIAIRGANQLASRLRDLVSPECTTLQADAARIATEIRQSMREEEERYDETTRHGATEGASLQKIALPPP